MNLYILLASMLLLPVVFSCYTFADGGNYTAPGIGYIEVRSDQEGARVYFDTLYMGYVSGGSLTVPVDTTVSPVWKNVRLEYTGYPGFTGPFIQTEPGKTSAYQVNLSHIPNSNYGIVKFISDPSGAEILINGKNMGSSPDSGLLVLYTIPRGYYQVEARKPGYTSISDNLYVDDNAVTTYKVSLIPSPLGSLEVKSVPDNADIYMDNKNVGLTPVILNDITVGEHTVIIKKEGYQDWSAKISVVGGSMGVIESVLVTKPAPVCGSDENVTNRS